MTRLNNVGKRERRKCQAKIHVAFLIPTPERHCLGCDSCGGNVGKIIMPS